MNLIQIWVKLDGKCSRVDCGDGEWSRGYRGNCKWYWKKTDREKILLNVRKLRKTLPRPLDRVQESDPFQLRFHEYIYFVLFYFIPINQTVYMLIRKGELRKVIVRRERDRWRKPIASMTWRTSARRLNPSGCRSWMKRSFSLSRNSYDNCIAILAI